MIIFYKYLGILLIPIIKINLFIRTMRGKEQKNRLLERYGISSVNRPEGNLIWIHAASVGEFKSTDIIINTLYKKYNILVTTTTLSAANFASENYGNKIIHQFAPLDISLWVDKFLNNWKPNLVIWIESDLWPITTNLLKKRSIKSLLMNVRMSPKSYERWKNINFFYKEMIDCFSDIFAQSQLDKDRIKKLTDREIKFIGNLKLSSSLKKAYIQKEELNHDFEKYKIFMLASTHHDEELCFMPIIKKLLDEIDKLKIIIAPRHPERSDSILSAYNKYKIKTKIMDDRINFDKEDVFIINSFGNLSKYFKISDIVFLGGSLIPKGGHNPIEPATNSCVIITGQHIFNWQNIYEDLLENKACFVIEEIVNIEKNILDILKNDKLLKIMKDRSQKVTSKKYFDNEKFIQILNKYLNTTLC